jgi:hypothetical protein
MNNASDLLVEALDKMAEVERLSRDDGEIATYLAAERLELLAKIMRESMRGPKVLRLNASDQFKIG